MGAADTAASRPPRSPVARALPAVVVGVSVVLFWRGSLDVFNTTKATVVVVGAVAVLAVGAVGASRRGTVRLPGGLLGWSAVGYVAAFTLVTVVGHAPLRSVAGVPGRHVGLAVGVAALVLLLMAADADRSGRLALTAVLVAVSVPVSCYAVLQALGADPLAWATVEGGVPVFSTFGNVDFASAWLGMAAALAIGLAASAEVGVGWRRGAVAAALLAGLAAMLTGSLQGPVVLAIGVVGHAAAAARRRGWARRQLAGGGVLLAVLGLLALLGPAAGVVEDAERSLATRVPKWEAALTIAADSPVVGRGPDTYEDFFFAARSPEEAADAGLARSVDNAHNVALHLLAGGGVLLVAGWLAVMVVGPALAVWRGRRRLGEDPLAAGAVLGWLGYLAQATVSIDVPPLAATGALLAGLAIAGTGGMRVVVVALPRWSRTTAARAVAVVVAVVLLVPLTRAWRADVTGWSAEVARAFGNAEEAARLTAAASTLAPWDARLPAAQGAWMTGLGLLEQALVQQRLALATRPRDLSHALNVARLLDALEADDEAAEAYDRVLAIDPHTPAVLAEVGLHRLAQGEVGEGESLLRQAVAAVGSAPAEWLEALGQAAPSPAPTMELAPSPGRPS